MFGSSYGKKTLMYVAGGQCLLIRTRSIRLWLCRELASNTGRSQCVFIT